MAEATAALTGAAEVHDASKLREPEKSTFDWATPRLKHMKMGSKGYEDARAAMRPALLHHYSQNRHHPEYHGDKGVGIYKMDLLDLIEMVADWKAATERHEPPGKLRDSIEGLAERFGYDDRMKELLLATVKRLGWVK